jgi:hypothetical protein
LFCLRVITINPALITSDNPGKEGCVVGGYLTKLLADVDTLLLLISCQNPRHKFGGDAMHAQFSSQNPLACPITNSDLVSKVLNGSTSILTNELLKFATVTGVVQLMGLPVCLSSSMDVRPDLNRACHSNTRLRLMLSSPNACLIRVSVALFPRFAQNLIHTRYSFVGSIAKSHHTRYTTPNKRT